MEQATLRRARDFLKRNRYVIALAFIGFFILLVWAANRGNPLEWADVSPRVLAALPKSLCDAGPKFKILTTSFKRQIRQDGMPSEVSVERTDRHLGNGIALRLEKWFERNDSTPVFENRSFIVCGFLTLDYHERTPSPLSGELLKEAGWLREQITRLEIREFSDFPQIQGGVFNFTKQTVAELNSYTGLQQATTRATRCSVVQKLSAADIHPKLGGDAYQVNCTANIEALTSGGIPPQKMSEKVQRTTAFYYVEQLGWLVQSTSSESAESTEGAYKTGSILVDFSVE